MSWNPRYALLILASTAITYLSGRLIHRTNSKIDDKKKQIFQRRLWVALSFASNLSILFFFKYFDFAINNINLVLSFAGIEMLSPAFDVLLPIGISFYTFQALSYTMDVYRGEIGAEKNFAKYALFVSFFPLLVAGPIERSKNLLVQVHEKHTFNYKNARDGLFLMLWGFFQKIVIADRAAIVVVYVFDNYLTLSGIHIVIGILLFAVQIYCDFSAYSDIAFGAAKVLGFRATTNFKQPYLAKSIQEFWHRWHISLSTWFRDYLYIPLGGSRCSRSKKYRNVMITFLVSGLWHGANWNFLVWGGLHGAYQVIGDATKSYKQRVYDKLGINTGARTFKLGRMLTTFVLVNIAWIFFRAPGPRTAFGIIWQMLTEFNIGLLFDGSLYTIGLSLRESVTILASLVVLLFVDYNRRKHNIFERLSSQKMVVRWAIYIFIAISILVFGIYGADFLQTQFIYFQF
jgi:D-alanyl-lipoteichoic acid acyltransferase DltB (MBOAT superfamily)